MSSSHPINANVLDRDAGPYSHAAPPPHRSAAAGADDVTAPARALPPDPGLRWAVQAFESVQRERIAVGEQIRAAVQGRLGARHPAATAGTAPELDGTEPGDAAAPCDLIKAIRRGIAASSVPVLDALYRRLVAEEAEMGAVMAAVVRQHPAWPWIAEVRGVGANLAARLLSRLDVGRAATPSAFWAYCGLHTEPARRFGCETCGAELVLASTGDAPRPITLVHRAPAARVRECRGLLVPRLHPTTRQAPRGALSHERRFNREARVLCHLVGVAMLRQGSHYRRAYRDERTRLSEVRPSWTPGRSHLAALRRIEKLFLAHLWIVWRARVGLPVGAPHPAVGEAAYDPWSMVGR